VGIVRGAYHVFQWRQDPEKQASAFAQVVTLKDDDLPPVLDIEPVPPAFEPITVDPDFIRSLRTCLRAFAAKTHRVPIIFVNVKTFTNREALIHEFSDYRFWIADYSGKEPSESWRFWQFAWFGYINGLGRGDVSTFNGSVEDLKAFVRASVVPSDSP